MGFRQKNTNDLITVQSCEVAEPAINYLLPKLTALLEKFSAPRQLGHIERQPAGPQKPSRHDAAKQLERR